MLHKVLAFMKATTLKSLWVELTETLQIRNTTDRQTQKQINKQITSTEQNPSSQAYSPSATQQIPSVLYYPNVRYCGSQKAST
jgi:hypothetical protein